MEITAQPCIGIFDSGIGGLSVLKEIHQQLPDVPLYYVADQAHVPYGKRGMNEIRGYAVEISCFLIKAGAQLIVVACNTASAAALKTLRQKFPTIPIVGMEPAVKPAVLNTRSGTVGVLATPATFEAEVFHSLVERFASNVKVLTNTAPGLVEAVEAGEFNSPSTKKIIEKGIRPMLEKGADTIVLGCTHFPFVLPLIRDVAGSSVNIIDPSPAIAKRTAYLIKEAQIKFPQSKSSKSIFATSGDIWKFRAMVKKKLDVHGNILQLRWENQKIVLDR